MQPQILVPLDGSPLAEAILPWVIPLAHAGGRSLILAQAIPPVTAVDPVLGMVRPPAEIAAQQGRAQAAAITYLADIAGRLHTGGHEARTAVLTGDPAAAIVTYTAEHPTT